MAWVHELREITKEDYEAIQAGRKSERDFFNEAEICGYGAIPRRAIAKDGEYYIPYGISTSCD